MSMCETVKAPTGLLLERLIQPQPLLGTWPLQGVMEAAHTWEHLTLGVAVPCLRWTLTPRWLHCQNSVTRISRDINSEKIAANGR